MNLNIQCFASIMLLNDDSPLNLSINQRRLLLADSTHSLPFNQWIQLLLDVIISELSTAKMNGASQGTTEAWTNIRDSVKNNIMRWGFICRYFFDCFLVPVNPTRKKIN